MREQLLAGIMQTGGAFPLPDEELRAGSLGPDLVDLLREARDGARLVGLGLGLVDDGEEESAADADLGLDVDAAALAES